ncbi:DGQHR domain-containing protein [Dickeya sp. NCPPB 3274]|uniref:DGQHR domain-containing protein n=1 Tax=Dickeya sp. NCPPB 3274 TaxID=568766 RepID=UPI0003A6B4D9|nr:DGQHR domain-containing protein [Dickeya sp. NCPPB 3274]
MSDFKHFTYPCLLGKQGNRRVITISVSFDSLSRVLAMDHTIHTLDRSQRELNKRRASAFADYVVNALSDNKDFIIPPLIGNIEGPIKVTESEIYSGFGTVDIPMNARIVLFDGQHREVGLGEVCQRLYNLGYQTITLELSENLPLEIRQQFFSDINGNASKPNPAINLAYDRSNVLSQLVRDVVMNDATLKSKTDFERTNITGKNSPFWVSFKALCDASGRFITVTGDENERDKKLSDLKKIWSAWTRFTGLSDAGEQKYSEYVQEWLTFTAVLVNAFGFAVQELLESMTVYQICERMDEMINSSSRRERDDFFLYEHFAGLCVSRETGKIIANIRSQRTAATRIVAAIKAGSY